MMSVNNHLGPVFRPSLAFLGGDQCAMDGNSPRGMTRPLLMAQSSDSNCSHLMANGWYPTTGSTERTQVKTPKRDGFSCKIENGHATPRGADIVKRSWTNFETFCNCTSLHGWKYLSTNVNKTLRIGWVCVVLASMGVASASLDHVFFPSVTLCNINQGRRSFFLQNGLNHDGSMLHSVLGQAYFGLKENLSDSQMEKLRALFSSEEVMRKGIFTDMMYMKTTSKEEAQTMPDIDQWQESQSFDFITDAGWYFKTLAAQEPGENNVLLASYGKTFKDTEQHTDLLPFFGTDYGLCSLVKPQISFNQTLSQLPFEVLMTNYTRTIKPGIQLGKENGLTLLLDAEVYDYAFSPQRGEGFKLAIHSHMDQPIMALKRCQCVPFFHTMAYNDYPRICSGTSLMCMNDILRDIGSHTHVKTNQSGQIVWKPCLFSCQDQSYTTSVTTSTFPNMHTFLRGPEFCLMLRKLKSSCQTSKNITLDEQYPNLCPLIGQFPQLCLTKTFGPKGEESYIEFFNASHENPLPEEDVLQVIFSDEMTLRQEALQLISLLHKYARENLLLANIYIKDPAVTMIKRDQKIPVIWFVANVGGILGLCMGCSLVTVFEVLHHFLLLFLKTGKRSVSKIQRTMRLASFNVNEPASSRRNRSRSTRRAAGGSPFFQKYSNSSFPLAGTTGSVDLIHVPNNHCSRNSNFLAVPLSRQRVEEGNSKTKTTTTTTLLRVNGDASHETWRSEVCRWTHRRTSV
ncbi:hypothetical protein TCAL_15908 [Tigriopus californicus]|uniref:Uncharacterized protein n=1 Tax=Tigriopus californicus TaxID=6832 RepID=A0A553PF75_TIGCA|nr:hypothetical protein TCAL_15908 [Tigriopus californicus]